MPKTPPSARSYSPDVRLSDLVAVAVCAAVVTAWLGAAAGTFSLAALAACEAAFFAFYVTGSLAAAWTPLAAGMAFDLPLRLLVGYAVVNTLLFVLAWLSPLGIVANFTAIATLGAAAFVVSRPRRDRRGENTPALCLIGVALVAATLWSQDSLAPIDVRGDTTVLLPWADGFYHAIHVRMFGLAHGAASIQDFRMTGIPARLYHYGAYLTPALIKQASGLPSYAVFAGVLVPMGIFFTGLGAYVLVASLWGRWAGLGAGMALLLLPDGAQQGVRNTFLSYHWLAQISPGATFGLAIVALAWVFVLRGCRRGSLFQVCVGWGFGVLVAIYKAQFFVTIALVLLILPPIFLRRRLGRGHRLAWLLSTLAVFVAAVVGLQERPGIPLIRLDGSSTGRLLELVASYADAKTVTSTIFDLIGPAKPWLPNLAVGAPYLLLAVFGIILPLLFWLLAHLRKRVDPLLVWFPLFLLVNFLVMALGLKLDDRRVGTPEELQHRPFLLLYFAVTAWTGGAAVFALLRSRWRHRAKPVILSAMVALTAVPLWRGPGLQNLSTMRDETKVRIPTALLRAAEFIRDHGDATDVFQASSFDPNYVIAALADRQPYFDRQVLWSRPSEQALASERMQRVGELMLISDPGLAMMRAAKLGIRWFLLFPEHGVAWSPTLASHPVFEANGFRLYRFD